MNAIVAIVFISLFAGIFLSWFFYLKARHKERMSLIDKGSEGIDVSSIYERPKRSWTFRFPWLKLGILILAISLGFGIGGILSDTMGIREDYIPISGFMFGGLGMIIAHFANSKKGDK